jgi:sulfofructose kinase
MARLGADVSLWARIGDDAAGGIIRHQLRTIGVGVSHIRAFEGVTSATAAVIVDKRGERLVISEDDHEFPLESHWLPISSIQSAAAVFSDLTWLEGTVAAFTAARTRGIPTILDIDLNSGVLYDKVIGLADYAIFSAPAFRKLIRGASDEERLAHLARSGTRHAGVTLGAHGYKWVARGGHHGYQSAFPVNVIDTTGAGDAFHGAFVWGVAEGLSDQECARLASAVAAMKCRALGARKGLPSHNEVQKLLAEAG